VGEEAEIRTAKEAADHELIVAFGRLQGAANRLEYILGRALEEECGISHLVFEVLLILGRAGEPGLSMRAVAQEQVLTTGGTTRLVDRMEAAGLGSVLSCDHGWVSRCLIQRRLAHNSSPAM
jgi:DNA-binding MarR family transcriptional regulator